MKKILAMGLVLSMLLLCGCHGTRDTAAFAVPDTFDPEQIHEITFWAKNDTNMTQVEIYHDAIAAFEQIYPNIHVNMRLYTDYGRIYNDVITNISTGTTPNVCITYPDHIATYLTGENLVVPLDALMADEKFGLGGEALRFDGPERSELIPEFLEECKIGGITYAMPFMRSTECCYVNRDMVEKLGFSLPRQLTWDFVWEVSDAAMEKNPDGTFKVNGQKVLIPFIYKSTDNMMIQMLKQKDAGYSSPKGDILLFNDTTRELLYEVAEHVKSGAFSTFKISSYPANFLNAGQCVFAIDSTAGATWMGANAPLSDISEDKIVPFETVVMTVPQFDSAAPKMISQGPSVCIFNKEDPQEVLASWLFAQFLLTNRVQIDYATTEGYVPVTSKAQQSQEYQDYLSRGGEDDQYYYDVKIQASQLLLNNTENTFVTPVFNGSASLRNAAGQLVENVAKSVRRKQTVDDAYMEELYEEVTSLYRLDQLETGSGGKVELGPLPRASVLLLSTLAITWVLILFYLVGNAVYQKKRNRSR